MSSPIPDDSNKMMGNNPVMSHPTISSVSKTPNSCRFFAPPPEIRDIIYGDLFSSGNTAILRVSRKVHGDAQDSLYKQGICRIRLVEEVRSNRTKLLGPLESVPDGVPSFNITLSMRSTSNWPSTRLQKYHEQLAGYFGKSMMGHGDCNITLVLPFPDASNAIDTLWTILPSLSAFKHVTVTIEYGHIYHPLDRRNKTKVEPVHNETLNLIAARLSTKLGDPERRMVTCPSVHASNSKAPEINPYPGAMYLDFCPGKNKGSQMERTNDRSSYRTSEI